MPGDLAGQSRRGDRKRPIQVAQREIVHLNSVHLGAFDAVGLPQADDVDAVALADQGFGNALRDALRPAVGMRLVQRADDRDDQRAGPLGLPRSIAA